MQNNKIFIHNCKKCFICNTMLKNTTIYMGHDKCFCSGSCRINYQTSTRQIVVDKNNRIIRTPSMNNLQQTQNRVCGVS